MWLPWSGAAESPRLGDLARSLYPGSSKQAPEDERPAPAKSVEIADEPNASIKPAHPLPSAPVQYWQPAPMKPQRRPRAPNQQNVTTSSLISPPHPRHIKGGTVLLENQKVMQQATLPAGGGRPPAKQMQQEEVLAPLDAEERHAQLWRRANQGAGRFATARPGASSSYVTGTHNAGNDGFGETQTGGMPAASGRAYGKGCAGYSARGGPMPSGSLSPTRLRVQAMTARKAQEDNDRRQWEAHQKERARKAAQRAGAIAAARAAAEEERREAARREIEMRARQAEERAFLATQSARVKGLPPVNLAKAMRPPPTGRQRAYKKRAARPEWGTGHAGGRVLRKDGRMWSAEPNALRV